MNSSLYQTALMCPWITGSDLYSLQLTAAVAPIADEPEPAAPDDFDPTDYGQWGPEPKKIRRVAPIHIAEQSF